MNGIFDKLEWTLDDFVAGLWVLPDPDPELRRLGVTTKVYDAIKADPDVKSCIEDRQSTTLLKRWEWVPGDDTSDAVALRDAVARLLTPDLMHPHIEAMLSTPYYGMIPVEIVWGSDSAWRAYQRLSANADLGCAVRPKETASPLAQVFSESGAYSRRKGGVGPKGSHLPEPLRREIVFRALLACGLPSGWAEILARVYGPIWIAACRSGDTEGSVQRKAG